MTSLSSVKLSSMSVYRALVWARSYLDIKNRAIVWSYRILPPNRSVYWAGRYEMASRLILFNGAPTLDTVFHESVHWWQHEIGTLSLPVAFNTCAEHDAHPIEIEARTRTTELTDAYARRQLAAPPRG